MRFTFFSFNDPATTEIYTLSLHDALPIFRTGPGVGNVFPARARRDALFRQPGFFVVDEAAHHAHELAIGFDGCGGCGHDSSWPGWMTSLFSQDAPPHESAAREPFRRRCVFHPLLRRGGLYAITDGPRADLLEAAHAALLGGARVVQYRDKTSDAARRLDEARALAQLCAEFQVPLIINDDVELARASDAAGVHLGEGDLGIAEARGRLDANAIIGVSCYDSLQRACAASAGADYLAFGAFFPSPTKP